MLKISFLFVTENPPNKKKREVAKATSFLLMLYPKAGKKDVECSNRIRSRTGVLREVRFEYSTKQYPITKFKNEFCFRCFIFIFPCFVRCTPFSRFPNHIFLLINISLLYREEEQQWFCLYFLPFWQVGLQHILPHPRKFQLKSPLLLPELFPFS